MIYLRRNWISSVSVHVVPTLQAHRCFRFRVVKLTLVAATDSGVYSTNGIHLHSFGHQERLGRK
jgi:hypothetical protein